jgi:hypothetical protein
VAVGIGDRELDGHAVEERGIGQRDAAAAEVGRDLEGQAVATRPECRALEQRRRCAAVGVQRRRDEDRLAGVEAGEGDGDAGRRAAGGGVEDVGGELADDDRPVREGFV